MEMDALAERLLNDINSVLKRDVFVEEFDVVPVFEAQNKSPVLHVGHKLALEAWCVKHLYYYCYNKLFDWKEKRKKIEPENVIRWTTAVLLLNPDIQTAWNVRKEMILAGYIPIQQELRFSFIVLTRKPKTPDVFAHRKWILTSLTNNRLSIDTSLDILIDRELELCTVTASRYANNYHAWNHRMWTLKQLAKHSHEILSKELTTSEEWVATHVSDHSGMQYRQYLLEAAIKPNNETGECNFHQIGDKSNPILSPPPPNAQGKSNSFLLNAANLLGKELEFSTELVSLYPGHEALWYHRRFVMHSCKTYGLLGNSLPYQNSVTLGPLCKKTKLENCGFVLITINKELAFLEQCMTQFRDNSLQLNHASKYRRWLMTCLPLTI